MRRDGQSPTAEYPAPLPRSDPGLLAGCEGLPITTEDVALRDAGLRATRQRLTVLEALRDRADAVTAQELHGELRAGGAGIGLTTVYRTLTALTDTGFLDTFTRDGEQAFRRCGTRHHHHLVCESCNKVVELESAEVEAWVSAVAERQGFTVTGHRAEVFGLCGDCT